MKVTLPKGKCQPLPKVKKGGIFGIAFNAASSVINGVVDSACHLVFPVIKGGPPPWLSMDIYPPVVDFPPDPNGDGDGEPTDEPTSTPTSTTLSSSSSCSATGVPQCTSSCAISSISGTQASSCSKVCSTVTRCSGTGITSSAASTVTGTVVMVSVIQETADSSEWDEDQMSVLAEAVSEAPETLDPSIMSVLATAMDWQNYDDDDAPNNSSTSTGAADNSSLPTSSPDSVSAISTSASSSPLT